MLRFPATIEYAARSARNGVLDRIREVETCNPKFAAHARKSQKMKRDGVAVIAGPTSDTRPMTTTAIAMADNPSMPRIVSGVG